MSTNPILDDLHRARAKLLAEAGGDLHRYIKEARERALASGRPIANSTPRTRSRIGAKSAGSIAKRRSPLPGDL